VTLDFDCCNNCWAYRWGRIGRTQSLGITIAAPAVFAWQAHGFAKNDVIVVTTDGLLPDGVPASQALYVIPIDGDPDNFNASLTRDGAAINATGAQSGVHTADAAVMACHVEPPKRTDELLTSVPRGRFTPMDYDDWCGHYARSDPGVYPGNTQGPGYRATSSTILTITSSASRVFSTQAGLAYSAGARMRATSASSGDWMEGVITAYDLNLMTVLMDASSGGAASHSDWNLNIAGEPQGVASALVFLAAATASTSASLDFAGVFTSDYDDYLIVFENIRPATNAVAGKFRVEASAAFQTTSYKSAATDCVLFGSAGLSNAAGLGYSATLNIFNVNDASVKKMVMSLSTYSDGTNAQQGQAAGYWNGGNAVITGFQVLMTSGNIASGTIRVYGIKHS
jgi:hypothetical protein